MSAVGGFGKNKAQYGAMVGGQRPAAKDYHGLVNQGATCYLNSVLQVLYMTDDFRERVKSNTRREHIDSELSDLFDDLEKDNARTHKITEKLKIKNVHEQRDAAEHYEKILRLTSSEASQIFHGELINRNTCQKCKTSTQSEAGFWHLPLPLVDSNNDYSVEKGIEDFFCSSVISGGDQLYCETCDEKCDAVLDCEVTHHPEVLVLLLKRFEFDYRYMAYVKINQPVNVPYTLQIPQNQSYRLYAFVEHFGELRCGHYISKIWSQDDDKWYIFDDSRVVPTASFPERERSQSAYLLFYQKQKGTEDTKRTTGEEGPTDKNKGKENEDTSVRPALKRSRSSDTSQQGETLADLKKPKQGRLSESVDEPGKKCEDEMEMEMVNFVSTVDTKSDDHDITSVMSQASSKHVKVEEEVQEIKRQPSEKTAQQPQLFPDLFSTLEGKTDEISGCQIPDDHSDTGACCLGEFKSRNSETQENDRGGRDDVGLSCVSENRNGLELSFITMQTDIHSGKCDQKMNEEQGEQERYSVKTDNDESAQDQENRQSSCESTETGNFVMSEAQGNNNETRGKKCCEGNQGYEGTQSCTDMKTEKQETSSDRTETALFPIGKCEDMAEKTTEGDCDKKFHEQDVDVSDSSLGQQMYDPEVKMLEVSNQEIKISEFGCDNSTVDTKSDDYGLTSVMSKRSKLYVKVEEEVQEVKRQQSTTEKTAQQPQLFPDQHRTRENKWDRPDDQSETGACCRSDIRSRNSETLMNEKDGEDIVGWDRLRSCCVSELGFGLRSMQTDMTEEHSRKCNKKMHEEQMESSFVKSGSDESVQVQERRQCSCEPAEAKRNLNVNEEQKNNETRGNAGTQSCTEMKTEKQEKQSDQAEMDLSTKGRKCEDNTKKNTEDDCDDRCHRQDLAVSESVSQQTYSPDEEIIHSFLNDSRFPEVNNSTVDTKCRGHKAPAMMRPNLYITVKDEEEVRQTLVCKTTAQQPELSSDEFTNQYLSDTELHTSAKTRQRKDYEPIDTGIRDSEDDVAKRYVYCESTTALNSNYSGPSSMTMQANVTSGEHGRTGEEDQAGIRQQSVSEKKAQQHELSSDQYKTYENSSETQKLEDQSDSGEHALADDRRRNCHDDVNNERNPGLSSVPVNRNDLSYMIMQIDERVVYAGKCKQKTDEEQVERQETSPAHGVSVQDQGTTGGTGDARVKTMESDGLCKQSEETKKYIKDDEKVKNERICSNCHVGKQAHVGIQTETEVTLDKPASKGKNLQTKYDLYLDSVTKYGEGCYNKSQSDMHKLDKSDNLRDRQVSVSSPLQSECQRCTPDNSVLPKNERSEVKKSMGSSWSGRENEYSERESQSQGKRFDGIKKLEVTIDKDTEILRFMPTKKQDITQPNAKHELHEKRIGSDSLCSFNCNMRNVEKTTDVLAESVGSLTLSSAGGDSRETGRMSDQTGAGKDHSDRKMK